MADDLSNAPAFDPNKPSEDFKDAPAFDPNKPSGDLQGPASTEAEWRAHPERGFQRPDDHGLAERQQLSPVGKALSPFTSYWSNVKQFENEGLGMASEGVNQMTNPDSLIDPKAHGISDVATGAGKAALGTLGYVGAPISAAYRSIVGQPVEDVTGIPREYTEFAAQMATPGLGLPKMPGKPSLVAHPPGWSPTKPPPPAPPSGSPVVQAADRLSDVAGTPVNVPKAIASDSIATQRMGQLAKNTPLVGNAIPRSVGRMVENLDTAKGNIADELGQGSGPNVANRIGNTLETAANAEGTAADTEALNSNTAVTNAWQRAQDDALTQVTNDENAALTQARAATGNMTPQEMGQQIITNLRRTEREAEQRKTDLYNTAGQTDASVRGSAVSGVHGAVTNDLRDAGRLSRLTGTVDPKLNPAAHSMMEELQNLSEASRPVQDPVTGRFRPARPVSVGQLEDIRKRLGVISQDAATDGDRAATRIIMNSFDDWEGRAFDNALFSGSPDALNAVREARAANRSWRQGFYNDRDDADKIINKVVTGEITPQEMANWLVGSSQVGAKGTSSRLLTRIAQVTNGDPATMDTIRAGVANRLFGTTAGVGARNPEQIANDIFEFFNGSGSDVANRLFTPPQRQAAINYANALRRGQEARQDITASGKLTKPSEMDAGTGPARELAQAVLGKSGKTDEALFAAIENYAKSGGRGDIKTLGDILRNIPQEEKGNLAAALIRKMGYSVQARGFSPEQFVTEWEKYSTQAKDLLFGNAGPHRQALDDIATIAQRYKEVGRRFGNPSGTAQTVSATATLAALWFHPFTTIPLLVGGATFARMLSMPATAKQTAGLFRSAYNAMTNSSNGNVQRFKYALGVFSKNAVRFGANPAITHINADQENNRAKGGKVEATKALPADHQLGMRVPEGGSSCASCHYFKPPIKCGNKGFIEWNHKSDRIPGRPNEYCCDNYEHIFKRAGGGKVTDPVDELADEMIEDAKKFAGFAEGGPVPKQMAGEEGWVPVQPSDITAPRPGWHRFRRQDQDVEDRSNDPQYDSEKDWPKYPPRPAFPNTELETTPLGDQMGVGVLDKQLTGFADGGSPTADPAFGDYNLVDQAHAQLATQAERLPPPMSDEQVMSGSSVAPDDRPGWIKNLADTQFSAGNPSVNWVSDRLTTDLPGQPRLQTWPERVIRSGGSLAHDIMTGEEPMLRPGMRREMVTDVPPPTGPTEDSTWLGKKLGLPPVAWDPNDPVIERAQDMAGLAGGAGAGAESEGATLHATPSLRPALKYEGKLYKAPIKDPSNPVFFGAEHSDALPGWLAPEYMRQAMTGEDISNFNFGFINHKGQFMSREQALDYGVKEGLIDPRDAWTGTLTSTMLSDTGKPGAALSALEGETHGIQGINGAAGAGRRAASVEEAQAAAERHAGTGQPLPNLPTKAMKIGDEYFVPGPIGRIRDIAADYMKTRNPEEHSLPFPDQYHGIDPDRSKAIADAFEQMEHNPNDPRVKASYQAMVNETKDQFQHLMKSGLKVEPITPDMADPYALNPRLAAKDVAENDHLWFFPTESGYGKDVGNPNAVKAISDNPMLQPSGITLNGQPLLNNDLFRVVHDYFGHLKEGYGFRAAGEDNAWRSHAAMYSDQARPAMTTETRGQNSWVNYGPHGKANRTASAADTVYADQKVGVMPDWTMSERYPIPIRDAGSQIGHEGLPSLTKPNHFYRAMTEDEYNATIGSGHGVQSRQDHSVPGEGTSFASDVPTAESYANYGRTDPRKTGKPTYLVEVSGKDGLTPTKDGYFKAAGEIDPDRITRVVKMSPTKNGAITGTDILRSDTNEPGAALSAAEHVSPQSKLQPDETLYHGTSKDKPFSKLKEAKNGTWFTTNPKEASQYAVENDSMGHEWNPGTRSYEPKNTAARVIPMQHNFTNTLELKDWPKEITHAENYKRAQGIYFDKLRKEGYDSVRVPTKDGHSIVVSLDNSKLAPTYSPNKVKGALFSDTAEGAALSGAEKASDLWHGISQIKLPKPISEMSAVHTPTGPSGERIIRPADLQGGNLLPLMGDRSTAGSTLHQVNGYPFENPVDMQGGHGFMPANADTGAAWASAKPAAAGTANRVKNLGPEKPTYGVYTAMGERSIDFSHHMSDTLAEMLKHSKISREDKAAFDRAMRTDSKDFKAVSDWPGIGSDKLREFLENSPGNTKSKMAKLMDTGKFQKAGFPSVAEARHAVTDPRLLHQPTGASGLAVARMDPSGKIFSTPGQHRTYESNVPGSYVGGLPTSVPKEIMYPQITKALADYRDKLSGYKPTLDYLMARTPKGLPFAEPANQEWVDAVSKWLEEHGHSGLKKGGVVPARAHGGRVEASNINHSPSEAQKEAGNYSKDHVNIHGLSFTVENARGKHRSGIGKDGKEWKVKMPAHYGYIKRTEGADGDHVDVYLGPHLKSNKVFIVNQVDADSRKFDEHKCMLGFGSIKQAMDTYEKGFSDGKGLNRIGSIHEMTIKDFKNWLHGGDTASSYKH